jgi:hypothetical protein
MLMRIRKASGERQQLIKELLRAGFAITYTKDYYAVDDIDRDIFPDNINIEIQHINDLNKICEIFNIRIIYKPNAEEWEHHIIIYDDYIE